MSYSNRIFLYGPFLLLVALATSVMIYWWIAANALAKDLDRLNGHMIAQGVEFHFGHKLIAGFPFRLDTILHDVDIEIAAPHGPVVWHSDGFAMHTLTYARNAVLLESTGPQRLSWYNAEGQPHSGAFTPGFLHASAIFDHGRLVRFDLDILGLASQRVAAARAQFHFRPDPAADAFDVVADVQNLRFSGDAAEGLPQGLAHVRIEGRLAPGKPFPPLLSGKQDWFQAFETWRDHGGVFKVDQAAAFWGRCEATSSGTVALGYDRRLNGALHLSLANCDALPKQAATVTEETGAHRPALIALNDLAAHEAPDINGALPATIVFKDGEVFLGPGKADPKALFEPITQLPAPY